MIQNESNIRRWVREQFPKESLWVEHSIGGTAGFPDCVLMIDGRLWPIELKYSIVNDGDWGGELRPAQVRVGEILMKNGIEMHILVGSEFQKVLWMTSFSNYFHRYGTGDATKMVPVDGRKSIVAQLNKIKLG
jgi:hypothetical protein